MTGIDPLLFMQELADDLDGMSNRPEIEAALDQMEYWMEALDPEFQAPAYDLIEALRRKLEELSIE